MMYCSVNASLIHSRWVKYYPWWPSMTDYGPGWHSRGQGGIRGSRGATGGSRQSPATKRVIKQQNNDPKPWFKVPKVCCDPKGMVFTHFWGIWGHLEALQQRYLLKTPICQKPGLRKIFIQSFPQPNFTIGWGFLAIFHKPLVHWGLWKNPKPFRNGTCWSV